MTKEPVVPEPARGGSSQTGIESTNGNRQQVDAQGKRGGGEINIDYCNVCAGRACETTSDQNNASINILSRTNEIA
jgi:hypothetical protein